MDGKSKRFDLLIIICLVIVFAITQFSHFKLDFWNDETYTLEHFVFVPVKNIAFANYETNNHILYSLVTKCFVTLSGQSLAELLDKPYLLRLLSFLFSASTIITIYLIGIAIQNRTAAILSAVILITSIPFYNFALQVRGYCLSIFLDTVIILFLVSDKPIRLKFTGLILLSALSFYTQPLNIYFLFTVCLYGLLTKNFRAAVSVIIGLGIAMLLYTPIYQLAFNNEYVKGENFNWNTMQFIPTVFEYFFSIH